MNHNDEHDNIKDDTPLPQKFHDAVLCEIRQIPPRPILEFLVKIFLVEVNWMNQLLHHERFMGLFEQWWDLSKGPSFTVDQVDFAVLVLRVCLLASQYLPSTSYPLDTIRGVALPQIRDTCSAVADSLAARSARADHKGSLFRLQNICFGSLNASCEGNSREAWVMLNHAINMAETLNYHNNRAIGISPSPQDDEADGPEQEMKTRILYNLYIWDRYVGCLSCCWLDGLMR